MSISTDFSRRLHDLHVRLDSDAGNALKTVFIEGNAAGRRPIWCKILTYMRLSVITVCYNAASELVRTLDSIRRQSHSDLEQVIVDGGSTDATRDVLDTVGGNARIVSEPDQGIYDAMNKGIRLASGDVILFMNAGDYFYSDFSAELGMQFLDDEPDVDVAYGGIEIRYLNGHSSIFMPDGEIDPLEFLITRSLPHQATLARREAFAISGLFDRRYRTHGDYEWFLRVAADPRLRIKSMPVMIASFALGGASSNIATAERERHLIQNGAAAYRRPGWATRRIMAYQELYIGMRTEIERQAAPKLR